MTTAPLPDAAATCSRGGAACTTRRHATQSLKDAQNHASTNPCQDCIIKTALTDRLAQTSDLCARRACDCGLNVTQPIRNAVSRLNSR